MIFSSVADVASAPDVAVLPSPYVWLLPMDRRELTAVLAAMHAAGTDVLAATHAAGTDALAATHAAGTDALAAMHPLGGGRQMQGLSMPQVELLLTRDSQMARWNQRFMGCEGPTNILSFPGDAESAGSLILSVDTLRREAYLYGDTEIQHLLRLLAHGLGHVAGFDHGPDMDDFCDKMLTSYKKYK